jgi:acetyl-CoA C-acetyltransferase
MNTLSYAKRYFSRRNVVIVGAKRTPIGTFMGGLSNYTAPHLGTIATLGALKNAGVDPKEVEEVFYGNVISAGSGQAPAR